MTFCPGCPNRWQARMARALGETALADEIEAAGCPWWVQVAKRDEPDRVIDAFCNAAAMHGFLSNVVHEMRSHTDEVHAMRNEDSASRELMDQVAREHGLRDLARAFAVLGVHSYLRRRPELAEANHAVSPALTD